MTEVITLTEGADNYSAASSDVVIQALGGNDTIYTKDADNVTISGDDGADYLYNNTASNVSIDGGTGNDFISNVGDSVAVDGGDGNDIVDNWASNVTIYGGNGSDTLYNELTANFTKIDGGDGDDTIDDIGWYVSINGGNGNDTIYALGISPTINGGNGDDTIVLLNHDKGSGNVVEYSGDGYDTVQGFGVNDTLKIAGSYSSQISDNNVMIYVGAGSIQLENAASLGSSLNIQTVPAGSFGDTTATIPSTGQVISNYAGQPVTVSGNFMGASFSGNNFVVNSSAGMLTIQNVTDKIVDLRDSAGNEFLKAYQASAAGVVDGRGINCYEIIEGTAAGMDVILAGDGGSQLWGGSGNSADAIAGGNGTDIFIGGRFQGSDVFYNVSSADFVNLTDATLSDIVGTLEVDGNIAIGFNTGEIVTIQSKDTLSAAINLADSSSWRFNHSTKAWQGA